MDNGVIKESELIQLDGTIDKLIESISGLGSEYGKAAELIKNAAAGISASLKSVSGATKQGRQAIDESAKAADKLAAAEESLKFALSETGKQVAWLKAQTADANKATVEQQRQIQAAATSYNKLKADIKELTGFFKSLTKAEREDVEFGGQVIAELREKNAQLKALNDSIKPVVQSMTLLQKTEQQLAYWQSEEGQKVLEVRKQIRELTADRKAEKTEVDALTKAQQQLAYEQSDQAIELAKVNEQIRQQRTANKLAAKEALGAGTAYSELATQYSQLKMKIDTLDSSSENYEQTLKELVAEAAKLHGQMNELQKSTGNYSLNVGNYTSAFDGFGNSIQQIIRELPTLKFGLDQFFLAISNNIPIFADMYAAEKVNFNKAKEDIIKNAGITGEAIEETSKKIAGLEKPTQKIIKSLFSWRTAIMLVVTGFTLWGEKIIDWVSSLFAGRGALMDLAKATKVVNNELKSNASSYSDGLATYIKLREEWKRLKSVGEQTKWIEKNESAWRELNVAINNTRDAERLFVQETERVVKAFMLRAKAAAAENLLKKKSAELVEEEIKKQELANTAAFIEQQRANSKATAVTVASPTVGGVGVTDYAAMAQSVAVRQRINENKIKQINSEIEAYANLAAAASEAAKAELGEYKKGSGGKGGLDLITYLSNTKLKVEKSTNEAITKAQISEFDKRKKEAVASYAAEVGELKTIYEKNQRIIDKDPTLKVKKGQLTPERLEELKTMQTQIQKAMDEYKAAYDKIMSDILTDEQINIHKTTSDTIQLKLDSIKEGGKEELELRKKMLDEQFEIEKLENSKLAKDEQQSEADIKAKYDKQAEDLEREHQLRMIEIKQNAISQKLSITQAGSADELKLLLEQIDLEKQAALKANAQLAADLRQSEDEITAYSDAQARYARGSAAVSTATTARTEKTASLIQKSTSGKGKERRQARRELGAEGSRTRQKYDIDTQLLAVEAQLTQFQAKKLNLSAEEVANLKLQREQLKAQKKELSGFSGVMSGIAEDGLGGGLLGALGLDEAGIAAFNVAVNAIMDGLSEIFAMEVEMAEQAVEAAQERVSAAQAAYDAEIEARNNGYANSVDTAKKQLEDEKKNEEAKQKMLEQARKKQQALDAAAQASSLVTAVAGLWASYSIMGPAAVALAGIATAALFASFVASQIHAAQVTKQQYGEGGLEFLEGGSHASGNDIDLGTTNGKGKRMYAEGGEAMAIINKRSTRRYKDVLPSIVDSLNKGTFEEKFLNAFNSPGIYEIAFAGNNADLSKLESDVRKIREQGDSRTHVLPDGSIIIYYKNVRRIVRKS